MTSTVTYVGKLRTKAQHLRSGTVIETDAPVDNRGLGEAFSPTDLVATSVASCILTIMGIKAEERGFGLGRVAARVEKTMASNPRRIAKVEVWITFDRAFDEKTRAVLERTAHACPVSRSLHPDVEEEIHLEWKQ